MRDPSRLPSLLFALGTLGLVRIGPYQFGVPGWVVMLLLLTPLGLWVIGSMAARDSRGKRGHRWKVAGSLLYALLFAWLAVHALSWRPPGWPLWLFLAALGMAPAVVTMVERR